MEKVKVTRTYEVEIKKEDLDRIEATEFGTADLFDSATRCADGGDTYGTLCWVKGSLDRKDPTSRGDCWLSSKDVSPGDVVLDHVYFEVEEIDVEIE